MREMMEDNIKKQEELAQTFAKMQETEMKASDIEKMLQQTREESERLTKVAQLNGLQRRCCSERACTWLC